jgi:hypothetical protein
MMGNDATTSDPFSALIGKALVDDTFRAKLLDPAKRAAALQEIGVDNPTPAQLQALQNAITAIQGLNGAFQKDVGAG